VGNALKAKPAIGEDTDPAILALSKPLGELKSIGAPTYEDDINVDITSWRRLHLSETLELMAVVDFMNNFGYDLLGWAPANLSLGNEHLQ
jgi:hypothetical protein